MKELQKYKWSLVSLLLGIVCITLGAELYRITNLSTEYRIPKGAVWVGIGPKGNITPVSTKLVFRVSVPYSKMNLEVFFNFTEFKKYHIYVTMPYETLEAKPYVRYKDYPYYDATSEVGNISSYFKNFSEKGSSAINATFIPNSDFPFENPVALSIEATVSDLVAIKHPLGSKHTIILTFFGGQGAIWDDEFVKYTGLNNHEMSNYPFQVIIQFPTENYLASDTYPNPTTVFITEGFRSAKFDLDFTYRYPEWRGQSISCSFSNPRKENERNLFTFLSGTLIALGITLCLETLREMRRKRNTKTSPEEKPKELDKKADKEEKDKPYREKILGLIKIVDADFSVRRYKWRTTFERILVGVIPISAVIIVVLWLFFTNLAPTCVYCLWNCRKKRSQIGISRD